MRSSNLRGPSTPESEHTKEPMSVLHRAAAVVEKAFPTLPELDISMLKQYRERADDVTTVAQHLALDNGICQTLAVNSTRC